MNAQQASKALKILGVLFLVHAILVSTHEGEFWPFSIYPMFSQAGNPWARAMVLDVTDLEESELWVEHVYPLRSDERVVSLRALGVDQIDYSNFVVRTTDWTESRQRALHSMIGAENLKDKKWLVTIVKGELAGEDKVIGKVVPLILLTEDEIRLKQSQLPVHP